LAYIISFENCDNNNAEITVFCSILYICGILQNLSLADKLVEHRDKASDGRKDGVNKDKLLDVFEMEPLVFETH
jgi:hypothetical protein